MNWIWPPLVSKTGGIKKGELVVIGAFSKKDKCMHQIQVRKFDSETWVDYRRPWLTHDAAQEQIQYLEKLDEARGEAGVYVYQIAEV